MKLATAQRLRYIFADLVTANIAVFLFDIMRYNIVPPQKIGAATLENFLAWRVIILEQIFLPLFLLAVYWLSGFYNQPLNKGRIQTFFATSMTSIVGTLVIYFAILSHRMTSIRLDNILFLVWLFLLLLTLTYLGRWAVSAFSMWLVRTGRWRYHVAVAGNKEERQRIASEISRYRRRTGQYFAGYIAEEADSQNGIMNISELSKKVGEGRIDEIVIANQGMDEAEIYRLLYQLMPLEIPIKIAPDSVTALNSAIRLQSIYEEPYIDASQPNVSQFTLNSKRLLDICLSTLALTVLAIPMGVLAVLVRRSGPGPIIFRQERIGRRQRPFFICKFRTMRRDAEASGPQLSHEGDPRVTPIGNILRKYRLDELPQFWNVLKGDMSLVGPRPERRFFIERIMAEAPAYSMIHVVRPGITSWGMVKYGYATRVSEMVRRLRYDLIYIANISIAADLKILVYTVKTIIKGRGM